MFFQKVFKWFQSTFSNLNYMEIVFRTILTSEVVDALINLIKIAEQNGVQLNGQSKRKMVEDGINDLKHTLKEASQLALHNASQYLLRSAIEYLVHKVKVGK